MNRSQLHLRDRQGDVYSERTLAPNDLPLMLGEGAAQVAVGVDDEGLYAESAGGEDAEIFLNGRRLTQRLNLVHGDVLKTGAAYIFVRTDDSRALLQVERVKNDATPPPVLEPGETELTTETGSDSQSIYSVSFKPLLRGRTAVREAQSPWKWALAAALGLMAVGLWFLTSASSVNVASNPKEASIKFAGTWFDIGLGGNYLLRPGAYTLIASHKGHSTVRMPVRITDQPHQEITVTLPRLPGKVRFDTAGIAAELSVDNKPLGNAATEHALSAGHHIFTLRAPRHVDWVRRIEVEGKGRSQRIAAKMTPAFSPVTIESTPSGARVRVDNKDLGVTPLTTEIDAGNYTLTLNAPGRRSWAGPIQIPAGIPKKIGPIQLGLADGVLAIRTTPAGGAVTISGRYRGVAPLDANLSPGIEYAIDVTRAGYEPAHRSVPVGPGVRAIVDIQLKPILGQVMVRGEPADAQLFVDGEARGSANQTVGLPSTELKLEIRRDGYQTYATAVTPQPGVARLVEYKLLTPDQVKAARVPSVVKTAAGGELKLMPTGRYEMGSPRREAGSRANESRRNVILQRPFYMGIREVTNGEYLRFKAEHLSGIIKNRSLDQDNHPVVNVSWNEAAEFCNWLSEKDGLPAAYEQRGDAFIPVSPATTGYRLPTEAEWEWVARYDRGQSSRRYPWGASLPIPARAGNYADKSALVIIDAALDNYDDSVPTTAPVGTFPANPLGLFDVGGNVSEWMQDLYTVYRDLATTADTDPTGPSSGANHVIRDANWKTASVNDLRLAWRESFDGKAQTIGFRIARYAE